MVQLAADALTRHRVKLVVITPTVDSAEVLIDPSVGLDHVVLEDPARSVARALLGVKDTENPELPLPASILVDAAGTIRHRSITENADDSLDRDRVVRMLDQLPTR